MIITNEMKFMRESLMLDIIIFVLLQIIFIVHSTIYEHCSLTLITTDVSATIFDVGRIMVQHGIGSVVITSNEEVVGICTERDFLRAVVHAPHSPFEEPLENWMSSKLVKIDQVATVMDGINVMIENGIRRLLVVDNGAIIGIVSMRDLLAGVKLT